MVVALGAFQPHAGEYAKFLRHQLLGGDQITDAVSVERRAAVALRGDAFPGHLVVGLVLGGRSAHPFRVQIGSLQLLQGGVIDAEQVREAVRPEVNVLR